MRPAIILAIGACLFAGTPAVSDAQASASDSAAIHDVLRQFHAALARSDSAGALALLTDEAVIIEAGTIESRAEYRTRHLPADLRFAAAIPSRNDPQRIAVRGDMAWVSSTSAVVGSFEGRSIDSVGAELAVLTRSANGWRIQAIHWSSHRRTVP